MSDLVVAACSHEAAKHAVENWHYSRILPTGKLVKFGVWEDTKFIGVVIFSRGVSPHLGKALGLEVTQNCELARVALTGHANPVSKIVAIALNILKTTNPGIRAVISFADPKEGHKGGIYQAGNWMFTGQSNSVTEYFVGGRWRHTKWAYYHPERDSLEQRTCPGKFRYIYPLDKAMRRKVMKLALEYPNAVEGLEASPLDSVKEVQVQSLPTAQGKS